MNENHHCKWHQSDGSHYDQSNCAVCKLKQQAAICGDCGHRYLSHAKDGPCCWDDECGCKKFVEREPDDKSVPIDHLQEKLAAILAKDVYDTLDKIAHLDCNVARVLGGKPCGKCGPCLAKPVWQRMHNRTIRAGWSGVYTRVEQLLKKIDKAPHNGKVRKLRNHHLVEDLKRMLGIG